MINYRINEENWKTVLSLDEQIEILTKKRNEIIDSWKEQLTTENLTEKTLKNGVATIGWKVKIQNRFSQKKFGEDHPDLLKEYKLPTEVKTFEY